MGDIIHFDPAPRQQAPQGRCEPGARHDRHARGSGPEAGLGEPLHVQPPRRRRPTAEPEVAAASTRRQRPVEVVEQEPEPVKWWLTTKPGSFPRAANCQRPGATAAASAVLHVRLRNGVDTVPYFA
jgi:hypothetical protein